MRTLTWSSVPFSQFMCYSLELLDCIVSSVPTSNDWVHLHPSTSDASLKSAFKLFKTSGVTPSHQFHCLPVCDDWLTSPMSPFERTMPLDLNPYSKSCFALCNFGTLARFLSCSISSTVLDMTYRCNSTSLMALFLICMLAFRMYMRMVGCATDDGPSSINQRYRHCSGFRHATG